MTTSPPLAPSSKAGEKFESARQRTETAMAMLRKASLTRPVDPTKEH